MSIWTQDLNTFDIFYPLQLLMLKFTQLWSMGAFSSCLLSPFDKLIVLTAHSFLAWQDYYYWPAVFNLLHKILRIPETSFRKFARFHKNMQIFIKIVRLIDTVLTFALTVQNLAPRQQIKAKLYSSHYSSPPSTELKMPEYTSC